MEAHGDCPGSGYGDFGSGLRGRFGLLYGSCSGGVYGEDMGESLEEMELESEDDE